MQNYWKPRWNLNTAQNALCKGGGSTKSSESESKVDFWTKSRTAPCREPSTFWVGKSARSLRSTASPFSTAARSFATVATRARASKRPKEIPACPVVCTLDAGENPVDSGVVFAVHSYGCNVVSLKCGPKGPSTGTDVREIKDWIDEKTYEGNFFVRNYQYIVAGAGGLLLVKYFFKR